MELPLNYDVTAHWEFVFSGRENAEDFLQPLRMDHASARCAIAGLHGGDREIKKADRLSSFSMIPFQQKKVVR